MLAHVLYPQDEIGILLVVFIFLGMFGDPVLSQIDVKDLLELEPLEVAIGWRVPSRLEARLQRLHHVYQWRALPFSSACVEGLDSGWS